MLKGGEEAGPHGWWCWAFVAGGVRPCSPFACGGVGPSLLFISGGVGPHSPWVHGGVGPLLLFMVLGAHRHWWVMLGTCHFLWVVLLGAHHFCGWRGWALVTLFVGGGGVHSSRCLWVVVVHPCQFSCTMVHGPHHCCGGPVIVGGWGLWVDVRGCRHSIHWHPTLALCHCPVLFPCPVITCPHHVIVPSPPCHCPISLLLPCPRCDVSLQLWWMTTNVVVSHLVAMLLSAMWHLDSLLKRWWGGGRWAYSPGLVVACFCTWLLVIVQDHGGWLLVGRGSSLYVGSCGSRAHISCCCHGCHQQCCWVVLGGWLKKGMDVTACDIWIMFKITCETITCMISHDDFGLVPWKCTWHSMDFNYFFMESGWTLYGITRHNNKNPILIIFHADSTGMSNSVISPVEFQDSSQIPGRIPGGE